MASGTLVHLEATDMISLQLILSLLSIYTFAQSYALKIYLITSSVVQTSTLIWQLYLKLK
jgi:hypothetical protein